MRETGNVKPVSATVGLGHPWVHDMKVLLGGYLQESDCLSHCNRIESSLCIPPSLSSFGKMGTVFATSLS